MGIGVIIEEILIVGRADFLGHLFHSTGHASIGGQLHKVADVAGPVSQISGLLDAGMVGHVHAAEHMGKVHFIAVGQGEFFQRAQTLGVFPRAFLRCNIVYKGRIFRSAESVPRSGGVLFHTCADVVDNQSHRVLVGMLKRVLAGIDFKLLQAGEEITVRRDRLKRSLQFFPLCIESDISIEIYQCALIVIGSATAVGHGVPVQELMVFPGKGVGSQRLRYADTEHLRLHRSLAAVCIKANGVLNESHSGKLCGVGGVLHRRGQLRCPAAELVRAVVIIGLGGSAARILRHITLSYLILGKHGAVVVHPSDGILVQRLFKHSGEYRILGNCRRLGIPAGEGVAVLFIIFLHRILAGVFWNRSGSDLFGLQNCIAVLPGDSQLCGLGEHRLIACVTLNACKFGIPADECIDEIIILGLFGRSGINRELAIGNLGFAQQGRAVLIIPGDSVFHGFACEYSLIGLICHGGAHCRSPAGEGIGILNIRLADRGLAGIGRGLALRYRGGAQNGIVPVHPIDRIASEYLIENCGISRITGNCSDSGTPAGKHELSVSLGSLGGNRAAVDGQLAIGDAIRFQDCAVLILPSDGARDAICGISGGIDDVAALILRRIPAGERVAVMFVSVLNRSLSTVGDYLTGLDVADNGQLCAVVVHPSDGMSLGGCFRGVHSLIGNITRDAGQDGRPADEVIGGADLFGGKGLIRFPGLGVRGFGSGNLNSFCYGLLCSHFRSRGELTVNNSIGGQDITVLVEPSDVVASLRLFKDSLVDHVAVVGFLDGLPAGEDVSILLVARSFRRDAGILGSLLCRHRGSVKLGAVPVHPDNRAVIHCAESSGIAGGRGHLGKGRRPAIEDISDISGAGLGGLSVGIHGDGTVFHIADSENRGAVLVIPCDGILVDGLVKLCPIGRVCLDGCRLRVPALEGIGILGSRSLCRCVTDVFRSLAVLDFLGIKGGAAVFPCDRERCDLPLSIQGNILSERHLRLIGIAFARAVWLGVPSGESKALIDELVCFQQCRDIDGNLLSRGLAAAIVGIESHGAFGRCIQSPLAVFVVPNIIDYSILGLLISAVSVKQFGRRYGDLMCSYSRTALRVLVSNRLCTNRTALLIYTCAFAGADICTALSGIQRSSDGQRTVNVHHCVNKVILGAVISLTGGVADSLEFQAIGITIAAPFILVIGIDSNAIGNHQICANCDIGLNAGQKRCGLVNCQVAAFRQIDGHVIGDRQNIVLGVDGRTRQLQVQVIDLRLAVDGINDAVSRAVIHFGQAAGDDFEHTGIADKGDGRSIDTAAGINRCICGFCCALLQSHCGLHVLDIILAEREHLVADTHSCAAAAEVQNLIPFIDITAGFYRDGTIAGDKAPCIHAAAAINRDITARFQPDLAVITGHITVAAAGGRLILTADTEAALHRESNTLCQRQGFKFILYRSCLLAGSQSSGSRSEQRFCCVMRYQQRNSGRDCAVLCQRRILAQKRDFGNTVFLCVGDCCAQIFICLRPCFEQVCILRKELGSDRAVTFNIQSERSVRSEIFPGRHIVPATELITLVGLCSQLIGVHCILGMAVFLGNRSPIHIVRTVFCGEESYGRFNIGRQRNIGQRDLGGCAGAVGLDVYIYRPAGGDLF